MVHSISQNQKIHNIIRNLILRDFENIDVYDVSARISVYQKAQQFINAVHTKEHSLASEIKNQHYIILSNVIEKIEATIELKSSHNIEDSEICMTSSMIFKNMPFRRNHRITIFIASMCSVIVLFLLLNLLRVDHDIKLAEDNYNLPIVLKADQNLYRQVEIKDKSGKSAVSLTEDGISYKALSANIAGIKQSIQFTLKNELADKLNSIDQPFVVTLFIEKKSDSGVDLNLLARGSGRTGRKNLTVANNSLSEYFIVVTEREAVKESKNFFIRIQMKPALESIEQENLILVKKITFTNF
jgi:hypothetical protein